MKTAHSTARRGNLELHHGKYRLRVTINHTPRRIPLHTDNRAVAEYHLKRYRTEGILPTENTLEAAAAGAFPDSETDRWQRDQLARLRLHVLPTYGGTPLEAITAETLQSIYRQLLTTHERQTVSHIRSALVTLWDAQGLPTNPARDSKLPKQKRDKIQRVRATLTDEELLTYLQWVHPWERERLSVLERQVMACVCRLFGGLRTSDLHALRWDTLDVPHFTWGWAPRTKTKTPQKLAIPEMLRPVLAPVWGKASEERAQIQQKNSGADGTRTRGLRRDSLDAVGAIVSISHNMGRVNAISPESSLTLAPESGRLSVRAPAVAQQLNQPPDGLHDASHAEASDGASTAPGSLACGRGSGLKLLA